jgi:hypothetical protein
VETIVTGCPKNDIKILLADLGFEGQDESAVGNCGLHEESNNNGLRLIGLASALNIVTGSTFFTNNEID